MIPAAQSQKKNKKLDSQQPGVLVDLATKLLSCSQTCNSSVAKIVTKKNAMEDHF